MEDKKSWMKVGRRSLHTWGSAGTVPSLVMLRVGVGKAVGWEEEAEIM